jgi:hypothetical protein
MISRPPQPSHSLHLLLALLSLNVLEKGFSTLQPVYQPQLLAVGCTMFQGAVFVLRGGCLQGRLLQKYEVGWFSLYGDRCAKCNFAHLSVPHTIAHPLSGSTSRFVHCQGSCPLTFPE